MSIGIWVFFGRSKIESLSPFLHSSMFYTHWKSIRERQIKCCGPQHVIIGLKWRAITIHYSLESLHFFLGRLFGGWQHWVKSSRLISLTLVNWCCLCKKSWETLNHLLIHCEFTSRIWHFFTLFGILWVMPSNMPMRERLGGNLLWMQSTVLLGLVGVL